MRSVAIGGRTVGHAPCMVATAMSEQAGEMLRQVERAVSLGADIVELRVDKLPDEDAVRAVVEGARCPHIVACRTPRFGGFFEGSEEERIARLERAAREGATAVDIEFFTESGLRSRLISSAREHGVPVLIGYENMEKTPDRSALIGGLETVQGLGPDLIKLAVRAHSYDDLLTVLGVAREASGFLDVPFAVIALGVHGAPSRPLACILGASFTYCAMEQGVIPGQLTVKETRDIITSLAEQRWTCSSKT